MSVASSNYVLLMSATSPDDQYSIGQHIVRAGKKGRLYSKENGQSQITCVSGEGQIIIMHPPHTLPDGSIFNFNRGDTHKINEGADFMIVNTDDNNILIAIEIDQPRKLS